MIVSPEAKFSLVEAMNDYGKLILQAQSETSMFRTNSEICPLEQQQAQLLALLDSPPSTRTLRKDLSTSITSMMQNFSSALGCGQFDGVSRTCLHLFDGLNSFMASSRNSSILGEAWTSWHDTFGPAQHALFNTFVKAINDGATHAGVSDASAMWKAQLMLPDAEAAVGKLYDQVPHCDAWTPCPSVSSLHMPSLHVPSHSSCDRCTPPSTATCVSASHTSLAATW